MSRLENSKRNAMYGFVGQIIKIISKFAIRTIVIYLLGAVYLGLDGLFLNVISILSLAELGIGNAVCFALYKPIANKNTEKINTYMQFYKKIYSIIGFVVLMLGLLLVPFLKYLVNFDETIDVNYVLVYILFLLNSVVTYWFGAYSQVLLIANQQNYIIDKVNNVVLLINAILQGIVLLLFRNYYIYLLVPIFSSIGKNIYIYEMAKKTFTYMNTISNKRLDNTEKKEFVKNVYALAVNKISSTVYTSSDNLVISSFVGTVVVGYYSNYSYIVSAISGFISILFNSVTASIGNLNVSEDKEHTYKVFKRMLFSNYWIYGFSFICFWQLLNPFIELWAGKEFIFSERTVFIIGLMFLFPGLNHTCTIFRAACGLFWQTRYRTVATAIVNVSVSILLVQKLGLTGVFIGTIVAYFSTIFTVDPKVLYREVFKRSPKEFYVWYLRSSFIIICTGVLVKIICRGIAITGIIGFLMQMVVCAVVPNLVFYMLNLKNEYLGYYKNMLLEFRKGKRV